MLTLQIIDKNVDRKRAFERYLNRIFTIDNCLLITIVWRPEGGRWNIKGSAKIWA